jgi:peptidoglycan/LPS O-acetylase OafA/YrhL
VAVAAVVLFHGGHLRGGYLGVDLFFVLSGFLITSLLLAEGGTTGRIGLGRFWARRARRLLPALAAVLLGVALYGLLLAPASELAQIRGDALATVGYVANWRAVLATQDYFALFRAPSPLQHTWSLAIEEQFYLVWPLVFVGLLAWRRDAIRTSVLVTALAGAALSTVALAALYDPTDPARAYYGTDTRAAGVLLGAALAAVLARGAVVRSRAARRALEVAGLVAALVLLVAWTRLDGDARLLYRGGFLVTQLAAVAVIAAVMQPAPGLLGRVLAWRPLCALGLVSYGVYLWHWPVDVVLDATRTGLDGWLLFGVQCAVTLAIATVSYRFLELPIRRGAGSRRTWLVAIPATTLAILLAFAALRPGGEPAEATATLDARAVARSGTARAFAAQRLLLDHEFGPTHPRVLLAGDSVSWSLAAGASHDPAAPVAVGSAPIFGCGIVGGRAVDVDEFVPAPVCARWPHVWRNATTALAPRLVVYLPGPWDVLDRQVGGRRLPMYSPALRDRLHAQLDRARRIATDANAKLVLLSTLCLDPTAASFWHGTGIDDPRRVAWVNTVYARYARAHPDSVRFVDLHRHVCAGRASSPTLDGHRLTDDGVHLTKSGSRAVWRWLGPQLAAAL